MSSNMLNLLKNMYENDGIIINNLIKGKVITRSEVIEAAIESNAPYLIYYVAKYIKGLSKKNIERLADALIEYKNIKYIYDFAKNVKRAPIEKLADITIKLGTSENIYSFARDVENAPIDKLVAAIIKKGNSEYIYKLISVKDAPISVLVNALIELKDGWYLSQIAKNASDVNIKNKILNAILYEFNNAKDVYNYARIVDDAPIDKLADSIINIGNPEYIYKFARDIEGAPVNKLADSIIVINNPEYIFSFAKSVSGAPIDKLAQAIIATGHITYMELFMHIEGAPEEKIKSAINRIIVGAMSEEEKLKYLFDLALKNDVQVIGYSSDIYRKMFIEDDSPKIRKKIK